MQTSGQATQDSVDHANTYPEGRARIGLSFLDHWLGSLEGQADCHLQSASIQLMPGLLMHLFRESYRLGLD
jgi:hypothetical protein